MSAIFAIPQIEIGGQKRKSCDLFVQKDDLVWAVGSTSGGGSNFTLTGVTATLIYSLGENINVTRVWLIQSSGKAHLTMTGSGANWDYIAAVLRPYAPPPEGWQVRGWYTNEPENQPEVEVDNITAGTPVFIHRYALHRGHDVGSPPIIEGVKHRVILDVLPEGATGAGNARETVILTEETGPLTVIGPKTGWMQVTFPVVPEEISQVIVDFCMV